MGNPIVRRRRSHNDHTRSHLFCLGGSRQPGRARVGRIRLAHRVLRVSSGLYLFIVGSLKVGVLDPLGLWLVVAGLVGSVALDMVTGAFFEDNGDTAEWGFLLGVRLAGLGLLWLGYRLRSLAPKA